MPHGVQMDSSGLQSNDQVLETPPFSTQGGLDTINLVEDVRSTPAVGTPKVRFQSKEDELLIQSWLNISKDPIVGVDQKGESFWKRIGEAYNKYRDKNDVERTSVSLKSRWHKINSAVQKFVGCYQQAVATHKSGCSENDIISTAKQIFHQDDDREHFTFVDAWRLLKHEPKWLAGVTEPSAKRTKNSSNGAYSSSSNPPTPTSNKYNPPSPASLRRRPMGQKAAKAAKRKEKEKVVETSISKEKN